MARGPDETALNNLVILRADNARMKRVAQTRRTTVLQVARDLIHFGVEHIADVEEWFRTQAIEAAKPLPGDETSPD